MTDENEDMSMLHELRRLKAENKEMHRVKAAYELAAKDRDKYGKELMRQKEMADELSLLCTDLAGLFKPKKNAESALAVKALHLVSGRIQRRFTGVYKGV